jgi:hypothetical protein
VAGAALTGNHRNTRVFDFAVSAGGFFKFVYGVPRSDLISGKAFHRPNAVAACFERPQSNTIPDRDKDTGANAGVFVHMLDLANLTKALQRASSGHFHTLC